MKRSRRVPTTLTVRNLPPAVSRAVRQRAKKERLSLSRTIALLLAEATGYAQPRRATRHHDLDRFFGVWSREEYDEFMESLREQRRIDPEMWK